MRNTKQLSIEKPVILILCEGQSEVNYFTGLKASFNRHQQSLLKVLPVKSQNESAGLIVKEAVKKKRQNESIYKSVWVVFDNDNQDIKKSNTLRDAFNEAKKHDIEIAYSSISWEHWVLWHFKEVNTPFHKGELVEKELLKHWSDYKKPQRNSWEYLNSNGNLSFAKNRAIKIKEQHERDGIEVHERNPYSNVYELLDEIESLVGLNK
jgi:hypothetical protein